MIRYVAVEARQILDLEKCILITFYDIKRALTFLSVQVQLQLLKIVNTFLHAEKPALHIDSFLYLPKLKKIPKPNIVKLYRYSIIIYFL